MSREDADGAVDGLIRRGRFTWFPVAAGRMEFAMEVRRALLAVRPEVVAVELPEDLERPYLEAVGRLPEMTVLLDRADEAEAGYLPVEPADPFAEAVRTARELGVRILFADPAGSIHAARPYPDPYAIQRIGLERYREAYTARPRPVSGDLRTRAAAIAWKLQGADPFASIFAVVSLEVFEPLLEAMEHPQEAPETSGPRGPIHLLNPHPDCLIEITTEYPFLAERYEQARLNPGFSPLVDRPRVQLALLAEAEAGYTAHAGETVRPWQRRLLARYTRNLALSTGDLVAGIFDLTVAARSIVDDNYAWEVWQAANQYSYQRDTSDLDTVRLSGDEIWLNTRKLRIRRRQPHPKHLLRPASLKPRPKERSPGEWARELDGEAICSYPPEDLVIEDYGRFLKSKARSLLSEERVRVEPFGTSILDGIDLRETVRRWYEGKIYVRQLDRVGGQVGSVVVIFDEDRAGRYPYMTTWLGENQNESDMAFYATDPFENLVGPGIGRGEYGGFLLSLPPRRMYNVWADPDYGFAETKPEVLLAAALDYALERIVVYVASRPPRSVFRTIAARLGRRILYIPIGQLSAEKLKKIRVVHVLDGYDKRDIAKDYIW